MKARSSAKTAITVVAVLTLLAVASAVGTGLWALSIPEPPEAPELASVELGTLDPTSRSAALAALSTAPADVDHDLVDELTDARDAGGWVDDAARARTLLAVAAPDGRAFVAALREPGCLDSSETETLAVLATVRAYVEWLYAGLHGEEAEATAREITEALRALTAIRSRCDHALLEMMMLQVITEVLHGVAGHALAAAPESRAELVDALLELEAMHDELPGSVRREWTKAEALVGPLGPEPSHMQTYERGYRRVLYLAERAPREVDLDEETVEERYLPSLYDSYPETLIGIRLGARAVVWQLVESTIASLRPRLLSYHRTRCQLTHRRARWLRGLAARGEAIDGLSAPAPTSPWTGEPLDLDADERTACAAPGQAGRADDELERPDLPPAPPRAATIPVQVE